MRLEDGFLRWAATDPNLPAVVAGADRRSYGQLYEQAAQLAGTIRSVGDGAPARVGLFLDRGPDAYVSVLATLMAGSAYVPINPEHPSRRIARTIELADLDLIVADDAGLACLERLDHGATRPTVLAPWTARPSHGIVGDEKMRTAEPVSRSGGSDSHNTAHEQVAYLLFTSGTTGDPKGVPITHGNVTSFLTANLGHYQFGPGDRTSQTFDLTFDLSVFDMFMAWGSGACLYPLRGTDLLTPVEFVVHHSLSVWFSVPAVAALQLQRGTLTPGVMPNLRTSLFCGEALGAEVADRWAAAAPNSVCENLYGPTELTIACTRYRWAGPGRGSSQSKTQQVGKAAGLVPIGHPFAAMEAVIVDGEGQPVGPGQEGELCLTGPQRFGGYWRSAEQTADRLLTIDGMTYYRTGDRARSEDGVLQFVGRADNQIQVLGHRVELGEVEAGARATDDVVDAVAFGLPFDQPITTRIGLAVTLVDGSLLDARSIRRAVASLLPVSMAPSRVEVLPAFALNANGKVDRRAIIEELIVRDQMDAAEPAAAPGGAR